MARSLDALFNPKSVALIGASANPAKLSHVTLKNLAAGRYRLYPVNPKETQIFGLKCYPSVLAIPGPVDLAVVSVPAELALGPVRECVKKGVGVVVVTSSGFAESGPEGRKLENDLVAANRGSDTRVLGPNTMGAFIPSIGLDTLFIPVDRSPRPGPGSIALLSQSGAVSVSFMEKAAASNIGLSACIGLGNMADITEIELLAQLKSDRDTKCIAMYIESFSSGRQFASVAGEVAKKKPVVVLKSGRTDSGARAACSHTGAMASSSDAMVDGVLRQAGVVRVYDEEELMDAAKVLAYLDHIRGDRICVVASAGGFGVIATDLVESVERGAGLRMASLSKPTKDALRKVVPASSAVQNPVDLTAGVTDEMYESVLTILQKDRGIDGIMMSLELQPPRVTERLLDITENRALGPGAPIVISAFGGDRTAQMLREFEQKGVPAYPTIWRAVRALRALAQRGIYLGRCKTPSEEPR
jgi:acyl-CoA synthetase (NDP forming)